MFDEQRYVDEVLNPLRGKHLPDTDLVRQYAVELDVEEVQLQERLRRVREVWTRRSGGRTRLAEVCQHLKTRDTELRKKHGNALNTRAWWQAQAAREAQAAKVQSEQLSDDLRDAFGSLGMVSRGQLERIALQRAADLDTITAAAKQRGIEVVDPVEVPADSGLDRTAYETLKSKTTQLGLRSIVPLLHPQAESSTFTLLTSLAIGGAVKAMDGGAVAAAVAQAEIQANSAPLRTRKEALGVLQTAVKNGVDLRLLALFHIAEPLRAERAQGLADPLLVRTAIQCGLVEREAKLLVLSLPAVSEKPADEPAARIRELMTAGELRAAEAAFATLAVTDPEHAGLADMLRGRRQELDKLLKDASEALAAQREELAEQLLHDAVRIAGDDPDVEARLHRLRPPPPVELSAALDEDRIRLTWQPPPTIAARLTYLVVRADGRQPTSPSDGTAIVETEELQALDHMPTPAADLHYAVFAKSVNDVCSRPALVKAMLLPAVTNVHITWAQSQIEGSWSVNPAIAHVEVRRAAGTASSEADEGVLVKASATHFADNEVREGERYVYRLVAVYRNSDGMELRSKMVHAAASTMRERPAYVEALLATAQAVDADTSVVRLRWITPASEQVFIRRSENDPPWPAGQVVTREEMDRYGTPVAGDRNPVGDETEMQAEVSSGEFAYTPFTARQDRRLTVGASCRTGICEPVRQLSVTRLGNQATVSWVWPDGLGLVEATITRPRMPVRRERLSLASYKMGGGLIVPVGAGGASISVRAIRPGVSGETHSAPQTVTVDGPAVAVSYDIKRVNLFSRERLVTVTVSEELTGVAVRVVAQSGAAMPAHAEQGQILEELGGLRLSPQEPMVLTVSIPKQMRSTVWLRCFLLAPAGARIVDPPPDKMKVM